MTVQFVQVPSPIANAVPSGPITVGIVGDPNGTTASLVSTLWELPNGKAKLLPADNSVWLTLTYSPEKDLGVGSDEDTVSAGVGSNPSLSLYGTIWACDTSGTASAASITANVQIEYLVKFRRLQDVAAS